MSHQFRINTEIRSANYRLPGELTSRRSMTIKIHNNEKGRVARAIYSNPGQRQSNIVLSAS